ncbi:MAG: hypothetical protein KAJ07_06640 [Planctomycetes bacterium]|nr:hypothetical protein [Planctomycetota bacterium]
MRFGQIEIIIAVIIIVTSLASPVGAGITWSGDVDPSDPSTWDSNTSAYIGNTGYGTMDITGGSDVIDKVTSIGTESGSTGVVTVNGTGSTWTNSSGLRLGEHGNGTLDITGGGEVSNGNVFVGEYSGSMGAITVDGSGSTWNSSYLYVGVNGNGTLSITNGGMFSNEYDSTIGHRSNLSSTVTVDGFGSTWTNNRNLRVGTFSRGTLSITGGATVSNNYGGIGTDPGGTGLVTVDGFGSRWSNSGSLRIGNNGDGTVNVIGGGEVSSNGASIGWDSNGTGEVTVDGSGSMLTSSSDLYVGREGNGTLNITGGGLVSVARTLVIDYNGGDDSFINMSTGGMLALFGDGGDSLIEFLELIYDGTDAIRYWDGSGWADITGATLGLDYTLEYVTQGDLAGYTMLTVGEPVTMYVDDSAEGANDGTSWEDAYNEFYDALDIAQYGDKILVAQGTYKPDTSGLDNLREASFSMINGVTLEGGYAGYGADCPDDRNVELYETILSGDLLGNDIVLDSVEEIIVDPSRLDNCYHVVTCIGTNNRTVIDGFTITAGKADLGEDDFGRGAGLYHSMGSLTLKNCSFIGNVSSSEHNSSGGGVFSADAYLAMFNCTFAKNYAYTGGGAAAGLMRNSDDPSIGVLLVDCEFRNNLSGRYGGGISGGGNFTALNCSFIENEAKDGGAILSNGENLKIIGCDILNNSASRGGGLHASRNLTSVISNCLFAGNEGFTYGGAMYLKDNSTELENCVFWDNTSLSSGASIYSHDGNTTLTNCTVAYNEATNGFAGGIYVYNDVFSVRNSIIWGNKCPSNDDTCQLKNRWSGSIEVSNSCVQDLVIDSENPSNMDIDPLLVDMENGDLHLLPDSDCIDGGDNSVVSDPNDLDGNERIVDGDGDGEAIVDMGAYEFFNPNTVPVAEAGEDVVLSADENCMTAAVLDGSGSTDADEDELTYRWYYEDEMEPFAEGIEVEAEVGLGLHEFTLIVNDGSEDSEPDSVVVTVIDDTGPEFSVVMEPSELWPPNNKMVPVEALFTVSDNCSDDITVELIEITSNEGSDDDYLTDDGVYLRAARSGESDGRVYILTYRAVDEAGNESLGRASVFVPHDRGLHYGGKAGDKKTCL